MFTESTVLAGYNIKVNLDSSGIFLPSKQILLHVIYMFVWYCGHIFCTVILEEGEFSPNASGCIQLHTHIALVGCHEYS